MRAKGFIGASYTMRSVKAECQRCVNLYPEIDESLQARPGEVGTLVGTPGLRLLTTLGSGPIRGIYQSNLNGTLIAVSGNKLYSLSSAWVALELGTLHTVTGRVGMTDNGKIMVLVDGSSGYTYDLEYGFKIREDEGFCGGTNVVFLDGYFVANAPGTQLFWASESYSSKVDGLSFGAAEGSPDKSMTVLATNRNIWVFGEASTEVFFDSGNVDFPFERVPGAFIQHGCAAKYSPAKIDNTVFWLGTNEAGGGTVWAAEGYQPRRVSNHAIEEAIQGYSDISDATGYTYQQDGHSFYVLNFPTGGMTWVFDVTTQLWHERGYMNTLGHYERHRADCHAYAFGTHIVGDWQNGKVYALDQNKFTDDGRPIVRMRTSPHLTNSLNRIFFHTFMLDMDIGVGTDGLDQGNDPQAMLQWSDDGGKQWSNEKWATCGKIGASKTRVTWRRLGQGRDRVFRLVISDPIRVTLLGAEILATPGDA